jgi:hypothetical protein
MKLTKITASVALALGFAVAPQAKADDWGCQVLLCLSNPAGPMAVAECRPPITRLYRALFKWRPDPFPTCLMSSGVDSKAGGNYAYVAPPSYYDPCPEGTRAQQYGVYAASGRFMTPEERARVGAWNASGLLLTSGLSRGIGESVDREFGDSYTALPPKICVGNYLGTDISATGSGDNYTEVVTQVFDRVVTLYPAGTTFNINVMIDHKLFRNIRPEF